MSEHFQSSQMRDPVALAWRADAILLALRIYTNNTTNDGGSYFKRVRKSSHEDIALQLEKCLIVASGLFDRDFYLRENEDVRAEGIDPLEHFVRHGGVEGRAPSEFFNGGLYLINNDDVRTAKLNPLIHFLQFGVLEGRMGGVPDVLPSPSVGTEAFQLHSADRRLGALEPIASLPLTGVFAAVVELQRQHIALKAELVAAQALISEIEVHRAAREDAELKLYVANSSLHRAVALNDELRREGLAQAETLRARIADRDQELAEARQQLTEAQSSLDVGHRDLEDARSKLAIAVQQHTLAARELAVTTRELDIAREQLATATPELERLQREESGLLQARAERDDLRIRIIGLERDVERGREQEAALTASRAEAAVHAERATAAKQALEALQAEMPNLRVIADDVKANLAAAAQYPSKSVQLDAIVETLRWPIELPFVDPTFDFPLFQKLAHCMVLAARSHQTDNLDHNYRGFSGLVGPDEMGKRLVSYLLFVVANWSRFSNAYHKLENDWSKKLFLELIMYRALGHEHVKLSSNTQDYWEHRRWVRNLNSAPSTFDSITGATGVRHYDFNDGRRNELECFENNIFFSYGVNQYYYDRDGTQIAPAPGDYVIDAGTCLGDTAVKMAKTVGETGRIYSFDPVSVHRTIAQVNVERNQLRNVQLMPFGLSDHDQEGAADGHAIDPGFSISNHDDIPLRSIDSLVADNSIDRVDFIKMDIEGSELKALQGAKNTLKAQRPKLAISIYHKWEDHFSILEYINSLNIGYRFYIDNYTVSDEETILYCIAQH